jgi:GDP/UDP-N,N'-diacetylbacillosamine 2-epimerase (hydrolysing)
MVYHPVLQEADRSARRTDEIISALLANKTQVLALKPNSDAGSNDVRVVLERLAGEKKINLVTHLSRSEFVSWMAAADLMIGNSSSGIIEAATFGTPVLNIGSRQNLRLRNSNVIDVAEDQGLISPAVEAALKSGRQKVKNVYGDGRAAERITKILSEVDLNAKILHKYNAY